LRLAGAYRRVNRSARNLVAGSLEFCSKFSTGEAKTLSDGVRLESAKIDI
jgi:hypothetical protein